MFLLDDTIVYSATDLSNAAGCEFALLRRLDERAGRVEPLAVAADPLLARTAALGEEHERRELERLRAVHGEYDAATGTGTYEVGRPSMTRGALEAAHAETIAVLRSGADVVCQAAFFDGRFQGYADFLVRDADHDGGGDPGARPYAVWDAKLARHAKVPALLQVAAYAEQVTRAGVPVSPEAHLRLGDNRVSSHPLAEIVPVYRERRRRLEELLDTHLAEGSAVGWDDPRYTACGRCDACVAEVEAHRDLLLVARMRAGQRKKIRAAGIATIDDLAESTGAVADLADRSSATLRAQARLQVRAHPPQGQESPTVRYDVFAPDLLATLPPPDDGDIFFDFEGDPLWLGDVGPVGGAADWGLEYLFGALETDETFRPIWAHDRAEEKQALLRFIEYVEDRRRTHPGLHVYHYAAYERSALLRLAGRHGVGEDVIDSWLRAGLLVDLYATVRGCVRISEGSYSIKSLEPLYMGDRLRAGDVTTAADSIVEYQAFRAAREAGDSTAAERLLAHIGDYNEYDCLSTLRLRDWLLERAAENGVEPTHVELQLPAREVTEDPWTRELHDRLMAFAGDDRTARDADRQAAAMLAAALGYHRRENKPFWWGHFDRLRAPVDEWADTRDVLLADHATVLTPWSKEGRQRVLRRRLRLVGTLETGTALVPGAGAFCLYGPPLPDGLVPPEGGVRAVNTSGSTSVLTCSVGEDGRDVVEVEECMPQGVDPYDALPMAISGTAPPFTTTLESALGELGEDAAANLPALPRHPGIDVLCRREPRTSGPALPRAEAGANDDAGMILAALRMLDDSYLAVQGPPGTGKSHVGAHVIAALVADGWRVGVVAQSHAVVESLLAKVVDAGVDGTRVAKMPHGGGVGSWTPTPTAKYAAFLDAHHESGCVVGGTAWTFANPAQVARGCLDLLVVDEAGQFSLANTLAASVSARRLLLLGDPQQLPQVSQGTHPEPVDASALGWLIEGHDTLPPARGYFLERTWRMHPALCEPVSRLSYEGRLSSREVAAARSLDGVPPGVAVVDVVHRGNAVESVEEAVAIAAEVQRLLGRTWLGSPGGTRRPLAPEDILVVAPFNAQVATIRRHLRASGIGDVVVGTVDRFQGREAAVAIVSMTVSTADDVPRGMSFVLNRNRLNVAVSRGQWRAVIVRSDALTDFLPATPEGLAQLGAFVGLCESGR